MDNDNIVMDIKDLIGSLKEEIKAKEDLLLNLISQLDEINE